MKTVIACCLAVLFAAPAFAEEKAAAPAAPAAPAPGMDMTKMGPAARKPKDEKAVMKDVTAFLKQEDELQKKGDMNVMLERVDFPVYMLTDDSSGLVMAKPFTREEYVAIMKPMYENMPKDMKTTHKHTLTVLSDSIVSVLDDYTTTMGKQKINGRGISTLIKKDGKWMWKTMTEAGWGESMKGVGGSTMPMPPGHEMMKK